MPLATGQMLARYRLIDKIGEGGMGVVWRATDTRLGRDVAIKVLPESFADDPQRVARFEREAKAIALLNHPNIVTIYSAEESEGRHFITMELVRGRPLDALIPEEGLGLSRFLELAIPLAEAVANAHENGVSHRDLKPQNVMVARDGRVKVLDFGLALLLGADGAQVEDQATRTITREGVVVGTVPYMSPEQLQAARVDQRTDLFSLGVMLYEMATGRHPFQGRSSAEVVSAILRDTPRPVNEVDPELPRQLGRIVNRCLEKDPRRRFQTALDLRNELDELQLELSSSGGRIAEDDPFDLRSIAVLPLANLCGGPEHEYFADGMTEALITDLARIGALKVISRTSVMQYKNVTKPLREIARELGVGAVVEGSVMRAGDQVRITAQLVNAATDQHLFAGSYDGELKDIFTLQSQVAAAIAKEVRVKLTPEERRRLGGARQVDPRAHEAYLRGRFHWNRRTDAALHKGIEQFNEAIALDPTYPLAYVGLADSYSILGWYCGLPPTDAFPKARAAARRALEIDPELAEAHNSLAYVSFFHDWKWDQAERSFRRALELNPGYSIAHQWYANLLGRGRLDEALAEMRKARELDPLSLIINSAVGFIHVLRRDYGRAVAVLKKTQEMDADFFTGRLWCGWAYLADGHTDAALVELAHASHIAGGTPFSRAELAHGHAAAGNHDEARRMLAVLVDERSGERYVPALSIALIHCALGEVDAAFEWLGQALDERAHWMVFLGQDPRFDPIRDDPRFNRLLERIDRGG